ncbi:MAG: M12 family metallo-peptidase [Planctomycetota bacterium]
MSRATLDRLASLAVSGSARSELPILTISAPEGLSVTAPLTRLYSPGVDRWSGYGLIDGGFFTLTASANLIHGALYRDGFVSEFSGDQRDGVAWAPVSALAPARCQRVGRGSIDMAQIGATLEARIMQGVEASARSSASSTNHVIEIMHMYTESFEREVIASGIGSPVDSVRTKVDLVVDAMICGANATLASSNIAELQVAAKYTYKSFDDETLVSSVSGAVRTTPADSTDPNAELFDEFYTVRDKSNCDVPVVLIGVDGPPFGSAIPGSSTVFEVADQLVALSASRSALGSIAASGWATYAHELGHVLGLAHEFDPNDPVKSGDTPHTTIPYAHALEYNDGDIEFHTIMYNEQALNPSSISSLLFSNDEVSFMGIPAGIDETVFPSFLAADSVAGLRVSGPLVAGYKPGDAPDTDLVNDCDADGMPDFFEIEYFAVDGVEGGVENGVPDACETTDPYLRSVYDSFVPSEFFPDINANGVHDSIDVVNATLADCDRNGRADMYQSEWEFGVQRRDTIKTYNSSLGTLRTFIVSEAPEPASDVLVRLDFVAGTPEPFPSTRDLQLELFVEGESVGLIFDRTISQSMPRCPSLRATGSIPLTLARAAAADGVLEIEIEYTPFPWGEQSNCGRTVIANARLSIEYFRAEGVSADADRDGILDDCLDDGCGLADWDNNGTVELADVNAFIAAYTGSEGRADFAPPYGTWDLDDIDAFVVAFGTGCP